jgi:DNA-binding NtrC family response regulator
MSTILIVDDDAALRQAIDVALTDLGHHVAQAAGGEAALEWLSAHKADAVLLDLRMPGMDGMEVLRHIRRRPAPPPVAVLTAVPTSDNTIEAMRLGAVDHLAKPIGRDGLRALMSRMLPELLADAVSAPTGPATRDGDLVGSSAAMREVQKAIGMLADSDATVLLLGETGTGKEVLAQAIHAASSRAHGPFVGVNVASIPETLLEIEFFGGRGRGGKFALAHGGTLFLDEVGDIPLSIQAKLLRLLQETELDVRVIAASSVDLRQMVSMGKFRSDLYYRLSVLPIELPPLRDRIGDLELLCDHILEEIALRSARPQREITPTALAVLATYSWPGNIRELRNVFEQVTMHSDNARLTAEEFTLVLPRVASSMKHGDRPTLKLADIVADAERSAIRSALAAAEGKKILAAELLGISRATLYQKLSTLAAGRSDRRH